MGLLRFSFGAWGFHEALSEWPELEARICGWPNQRMAMHDSS
jgi:hypothetical protein